MLKKILYFFYIYNVFTFRILNINIIKNPINHFNYYENIILQNNINYDENINISEEIKYYLNKNLKVYIHLEKLIPKTNIYHIGISYCSIINSVRYDLHGYNLSDYYKYLDCLTSYNNNNNNEETLFWGYCYKSIDSIIEYEKKINNKYIIGIYDCRHYVSNLTQWSMNKSTPIWRLIYLLK
tara:strand:+ start:397 stop:942 length:546 start_codon:yes stop_codon:yes gene_type:complete